jgi:hypothetical protein
VVAAIDNRKKKKIQKSISGNIMWPLFVPISGHIVVTAIDYRKIKIKKFQKGISGDIMWPLFVTISGHS